MKKKRRVEFQIERREISVFERHSPGQVISGQVIEVPRSESAGHSQTRQTACPTCGSLDLVLLADAVTNSHIDLALLNHRMQAGKIHYHRSSSDEWWICAKSLNQT